MTVPAEADPKEIEVETYDLSELAADAERATANLPPRIVDAKPVEAGKPAKSGKAAGVKSAPIAPGRIRSDAEVFIDPLRDVQAPLVLGLIGAGLVLGYYATRYHLSLGGIIGASVGLSIINIIEAVLLILIAILVAGPLGVSFGDPRTAWYKFAAIAIFCDGVTVWVDGFVAKYSGGFGSGIFGFGAIGLPVALVIYWACITQLFSMDHSDSWTVVTVMGLFYRIARVVLIVLLLRMALGWGGVARTDVSVPTFGGPPQANPIVDEIEEAKNLGLLEEARGYIAKMGRTAESGAVEAWYAAGAKNVWYELGRDFNGHGVPYRVVIELPADKTQRGNIYDLTRKNWLDAFKVGYDPATFHDTGEPYLMVGLPRGIQ
jgi:hypothetical protein